MEEINHLFPWLELMDRPAFCVKGGSVIAANSTAAQHMVRTGMNVYDIVTHNRSAYEEFHDGSLFLTITVGDLPRNASITRTKEYDIFTIIQTEDDAQLQALALAAQQLRIPLSNMMTVADNLFSHFEQADSDSCQQAAQINRNLFRMLRIISNMSDADSYKNAVPSEKHNINLTALFNETLEKILTISESAQQKLFYTGLDFAVVGLANEEKISRAVYNLVSNALKFSPAGSSVSAKLSQNGDMLSFTICNTHSELVGNGTFWNRYHRVPSIEDDRFGLGLGMTLVSSVACAHGGTVLVDHPTPAETRVTMTLAIEKSDSSDVRTPIFRIGDYAGGWDKGLLELSEILSADAYKDIN